MVGIERQRADCQVLASRNWPGAEVRFFVDNDLSAASVDVVRPAWQELLDEIRLGEVDELVAWEQSRLTRQPAEWEQLLIVLGRRSIGSVHTVREGERVVADGTGRMVSRILAAVDAESVETTKVRVRRALRQLAEEGRPNGGRPFGYVSALTSDGRKTRAIVPEQAAMVRYAARRIIAGDTMASIAREFERRQVPHVRAVRNAWSGEQIRSLVTSPNVAGLRPMPDGTLRRAIWDPILSRSTWERVRAVLTEPCVLTRSDGVKYRSSRRRATAHRHLLSAGIAICGVCGAQLSAQSTVDPRGRRVTTYICNPKSGGLVCAAMVAHRLEPLVVESMMTRVGEPWFVERLERPSHGQAAKLTAELERLELELAALARMNTAGELLPGEWSVARRATAARAHAVKDLQATLAAATFGPAATIRNRWKTLGIVGQRSVLSVAFDRIELSQHRRGIDPGSRVQLFWGDGTSSTASPTATFGTTPVDETSREGNTPMRPRPAAEAEAMKWLSAQQVAERLGLPRRAVSDLLHSGELAAVRSKRSQYVHVADVDALLERRRVQQGTLSHLWANVAPLGSRREV